MVAAILIGLVWLGISLPYARAAVRDDLRLDDLTHLRRGLEMYYNIHNFYAASPEPSLGCTRSDDPQSWFFGPTSPLLHERVVDAIPHDVRERRGFVYTYCITALAPGGAGGYYLDARLENKRPLGSVFDEDERRKFYYRVVMDHGQLILRICGGSERQCETN